jgi:ABC-type nickel/cobalt efflux system permease component RcnA
VQRFLYNEDRTGLLAVARLSMGYPLTVGALALTIVAVRRVRRQADPEGELATGPEAGSAVDGGPAEQPA